MKANKKSRFETIYALLNKPRALGFIAIVTLSLGFQNCAPSSSAKNTNGGLSTLESEIALQNEALYRLASVNLSCTTDSDCTTVEVGRIACGGPRSHYVVSKNNDLAKLQEISIQVMNLEQEYLIRQNAVSVCAIVEPPAVACVSNVCQ